MENESREIFERIRSELKQVVPWGHPDFIPDVLDLIQLHGAKNHDYAKGGDPLGNFDRTAAIMRLYPEFPWASPHGSATVQMLKQLDAYLWMQSAKTEAKVEGPDPRLRDIQVFAGIIRIILRQGTIKQQTEPVRYWGWFHGREGEAGMVRLNLCGIVLHNHHLRTSVNRPAPFDSSVCRWSGKNGQWIELTKQEYQDAGGK